ncbi:MAG: hypothetical protein R3F07_04400 [Opitutaceae bacterium]
MATQALVSPQEKPKRRWVVVVAVIVAILLLAVSILPGWLSSRWAGEAETLLAAGSSEAAATKAWAALQAREENTRALRVLIEINSGRDKAEAIQLSHRLMDTGRAEFGDRVRFAELSQAVGDAEGARLILDGLKAERPTDAEVVLLEARQAALDGNGDLALVKVEDALSIEPTMAKAKLLRGLLLTQSTDPVRRLQGKDALVDASLSEKQVGIEALMALLSSENLNVYDDERRALADRLLNHPLSGLSEKLMAIQNLILSDPAGRAGYVAKAVSLFEGDDQPALLVRWLIAVGEPEMALERIPEDTSGNRVYFDARISALMRLGRYQEVSEVVRNDTEFLTELEKASIQIYLGTSGDDPLALEELWQKVFRLAKENNRPDILLSLAQYALAQQHVDRGLKCYESAVEIGLGDRETPAFWQQYFLASLNQPDLEVPRQIAEQIVARYPDDASQRNNLAYLDLLLDRNVDEARRVSESLVESNPEIAGFRTTLALALLKSGDAQRAWSVLEADSIDWQKQDAPSRIIVALVAQEVGRSAAAQDYLVGVNPDEVLQAERELLEKIR